MSAVPKDFDHSNLSSSNKDYLHEIKFDKELAKSPVTRPRRCTDIICCLLFTATVVCMFISTFVGYTVGEPWKLIAPIDGASNICGYTPGYEDYTKLYIGNIVEAAQPTEVLDVFDYGVCVKSCPKAASDVIECKPTSKVTTCQPTVAEAYTTTEILSYCTPNYDSMPESVKVNWDSLT